MSDTETITISESLASKLSKRLPKTQYNDLSEYVEFILEEVANELNIEEEELDSVDSSEVEDRLKSLGYLDDK